MFGLTKRKNAIYRILIHIPSYEQFEVLGIIFDQHLKFNEHISRATSRASSTLFLLLRLKRLGFDATELGILYQSLVLSKLTYGITVWGGCSASNLQKFDQVQRRAVRMGVISDYNPIGDYIRLHDRQLMIKIKDIGTHPLRRFIKERSDYAQRSLRDRHPGCQVAEKNGHFKIFLYRF